MSMCSLAQPHNRPTLGVKYVCDEMKVENTRLCCNTYRTMLVMDAANAKGC